MENKTNERHTRNYEIIDERTEQNRKYFRVKTHTQKHGEILLDCSIGLSKFDSQIIFYDSSDNHNLCEYARNQIITFFLELDSYHSQQANKMCFELVDFIIADNYRKCGLGALLFELSLDVIIPFIKEKYFIPVNINTDELEIYGNLSDTDFKNGNWESSFPFYINLHNRINLHNCPLGFHRMVTILHNPENSEDDYNDSIDTIDENGIAELMQKFSRTNGMKKVIFKF